jgi:hypothetical protein
MSRWFDLLEGQVISELFLSRSGNISVYKFSILVLNPDVVLPFLHNEYDT